MFLDVQAITVYVSDMIKIHSQTTTNTKKQKQKKHFEAQYDILSRRSQNDSGLGDGEKNTLAQLNVY